MTSINKIKLLAVALVLAPAVTLTTFRTQNVVAAPVASDFDAAATYKAKCSMCHTPTASKFFDTALADDDLVQAILKGKKAEKPPNMPAFEEKGINADQAKELAEYMKGLKAAK
jgi:mono/diheme cytochrome c family protein